MGLLNHGAADNGSVLKHVLQIDQIAVVHMLCEIVRIMEMNDSLIVGGHNLRRKQDTLGDVLAHLAGHVVALYAVDRRVLVGIFLLYFLIVALNEA